MPIKGGPQKGELVIKFVVRGWFHRRIVRPVATPDPAPLAFSPAHLVRPSMMSARGQRHSLDGAVAV